MEDIIRFVEAYRKSVDLNTCDLRQYNAVRLAGVLLRKLKAKQPFSEKKGQTEETNKIF